MVALPDITFLDSARDEGALKTSFFGPMLGFIKQLPGGAAETELTIAAGSITPTGALHSVDTESDAASDDLANIDFTNLPDGSLFLLRAENAARTVVVKNAAGGAGQILTADGADFTLDETTKALLLRRDGADARELNRFLGSKTVAEDRANTFTVQQIIELASLIPLILRTIDSGAAAGPDIILDRESASPAANDQLGQILIRGRNSVAALKVYAAITSTLIDPVSTSEDGRLKLQTMKGGALTNRLIIDDGIWTPNAINGNPGPDIINAKGFEIDGVPFGEPGLNLLASATASASATIEFTDLDSTYDHLILDCVAVQASANAEAHFRVSNDNGSTFQSGASDYVQAFHNTTGVVAAQLTASGVSGDILSGTAGQFYNGQIHIYRNGVSGEKTHIKAVWAFVDTVNIDMRERWGRRDVAEANDAIQFLLSTGSITTGEFKLYGMRKS